MSALKSLEADRYKMLLQAVQLVNAELDLTAVLEVLCGVLNRWLVIDAIVVTVIEGESYRFEGMHVSGLTRVEGEGFHATAARALGVSAEDVKKLLPGELPLKSSGLEELVRNGEPYVCEDLAQQQKYPEDATLLRCGIGSFVRCALRTRGRVLGAVKFYRRGASQFPAEAVGFLNELASVVSTAVSNALAYQQIKTLQEKAEAENVLLREQVRATQEFDDIIGESPALKMCLAALERVAETEATVLIQGETGTGKELLARAIHRRSPRARGPWIAVNCAALPQNLIASELFGHEKGAFTGAFQRKVGRFEMANGGTLFLDEVGELPPEVQVALLRVIEQREIERVGGGTPVRVDVRLIAATHRDLKEEVRAGRFREDLYYRLNVFPLYSPALRERKGDVLPLVEHLALTAARRMGRVIRSIDAQSLLALEGYAWPGNVRELRNLVERGVIFSRDGVLRLEVNGVLPGQASEFLGRPRMESEEIAAIEAALRKSRGKVSGLQGAAQAMGLPASTLESKISRYRIDKFRFKRAE